MSTSKVKSTVVVSLTVWCSLYVLKCLIAYLLFVHSPLLLRGYSCYFVFFLFYVIFNLFASPCLLHIYVRPMLPPHYALLYLLFMFTPLSPLLLSYYFYYYYNFYFCFSVLNICFVVTTIPVR